MTQDSSTPSVPPIPYSIWALGSVSLLMKISSVIVFSLSPLFITQVLGASTFVVGLLEGVLEAISLFVRIFSGVVSDIIHRRKAIIVVGYVLALLSRPMLALANTVESIFLARTFDRVGNGLDATPRDALVGDLAPPSIKGACYGLRESLSRAGALLGALLSILLLWLTHNNYSFVFWVGSIPTALALLVLIFFVKDPVSEKYHVKNPPKKKWKLKDVMTLPLGFWLIILVSGIYNTSNFSGAFLILRAEQTGLAVYLVPLVMVTQNIATTLTAYPAGFLSDTFGKRSMMALGILLVICANTLLADGSSLFVTLGGVFLWGAEMGIAQSMLPIFLAEACPDDLRGTGFGIFHLTNGVSLIAANSLAGYLWSTTGPSTTFYASAAISAFTLLILPFIHKR